MPMVVVTAPKSYGGAQSKAWSIGTPRQAMPHVQTHGLASIPAWALRNNIGNRVSDRQETRRKLRVVAEEMGFEPTIRLDSV